jgi:hypothetical protein
VADSSLDTVGVPRNQGSAEMAAPIFGFEGFSPEAVALADYDGDRNFDMVVADSGDGMFSVMFGSGDGRFSSSLIYHVGDFSVALVAA